MIYAVRVNEIHKQASRSLAIPDEICRGPKLYALKSRAIVPFDYRLGSEIVGGLELHIEGQSVSSADIDGGRRRHLGVIVKAIE